MEQSQIITRKSASNLALAFVLLPKPRRNAMATLYAFCREVDDIADEEQRPVADRRKALAEWRRDLETAFAGGKPRLPVIAELQPFIHQYRLRYEHFSELLLGVEMDLDKARYASYNELELYCYRVASVVGLLSVEIFGYRSPACRDYAVSLGQALQLTNILRDVKVDAERGRIYLPQDELKRFGVAETDLLAHRYSEPYARLARSVAEQARRHYTMARQYLPDEDRRNMVAAELMGSVYWRLLRRLEGSNFDVFGPKPVRLGKAHKLALILQAWWNNLLRNTAPAYGEA
jgi:phytoene synthase